VIKHGLNLCMIARQVLKCSRDEQSTSLNVKWLNVHG